MGDFYLDLRPVAERPGAPKCAATGLRWYPETAISSFLTDTYALVVARSDDADIWSPAFLESGAGRVTVALAGRVALDPFDWRLGKTSSSHGGLACRTLTELYIHGGLSKLESLSGNFCLVVIDEVKRTCHLVTDRAGLQIVYSGTSSATNLVFCSHADVLAHALGESQRIDTVSLGEFIASGRITFPHTYYGGVKALPWGTTYSFELRNRMWQLGRESKYFELKPDFSAGATISDLSDELAGAFQQAVKLRSLPILGNIGIAMSGGMDSRAVLSCVDDPARVRGFVLVDEENPESAAARTVANACGTPFEVIKRPFDYYGDNAPAGSRIGGGTGALASNHFLGIRPWLNEHGISSLLTGCYCDYLFKALALNTAETRFLRREKLAPTRLEYYRPIFLNVTRLETVVAARLQERLPTSHASSPSDEELFDIESRRIFPLAYEGDCAQRVIGQRLMPWSVPMADKDLLAVYRRVPSRLKLNGELFREMLRKVCNPAVLRVPNSNTGASILSGPIARSFHRYQSAFLNRLTRRRSGLASRGSWPNWEYYIHHSSLIKSQWHESSDFADAVLSDVIDPRLLAQAPCEFRGRQVELFQRIWTLKLWLRHRVGVETADQPQEN